MSSANEIRSRRSVLAVLAGGATALAAQALGRPAPARAANGDPVLAGRSVTASARTEVRTTAGNAIEGVTSAPGKIGVFGITETTDGRGVHGLGAAFGVSGEAIAGYAVYGERPLGGIPADGYPCPAIEGRSFPPFGESNVNATAGVAGYSGNVVRGSPPAPPKATGVFGYSPQGSGVHGQSRDVHGVYATNSTPIGRAALLAHSRAHGTGIQGYSGGVAMPGLSPVKTGVFGFAAQDGTASGVVGQTTVGRGVRGVATSGTAVDAQANINGRSLDVRGRAFFDRSGVLSVATGQGSVTKSAIYLTTTSLVLATIQSAVPAGVTVRYVKTTLNATTPGSSSFTIHFNGITASTPAFKVAWFVVG
jgi:hypothetical protein